MTKPQLDLLAVRGSTMAEVSFQFPIFQDFNGTQLGTDFSFNSGKFFIDSVKMS